MPNYDKFMKLKSAFDSLGGLMADYEKDFGAAGKGKEGAVQEDCAGAAGDGG